MEHAAPITFYNPADIKMELRDNMNFNCEEKERRAARQDYEGFVFTNNMT